MGKTSLKEKLYNVLEKPYLSPLGYIVQAFLMIAVIVNVTAYILPLFHHFNWQQLIVLKEINTVTMIIFIIEYVLRLAVSSENKKYRGINGKLKWFIDPFNLIDFITILPFFIGGNSKTITIVRLIRPIRLLKFLRLKKFLKRFISLTSFASSNIFIQTSVLLLFSIIIILLFSTIYGSVKTSAMVFIDPPAIAEVSKISQIPIGILELLIGLFFGGALISILTSTLVSITDKIKMGYYPFKDSNHYIIINNNIKLTSILKELELSFQKKKEQKDIVLFIQNVDDIEKFRNNLPQFKYLIISIITGELLNENSYNNLNINKAEKILILKEENNKSGVSDIEIVQFILTSKNFNNTNLNFVIETEKNTNEIDNLSTTRNIYATLFKDRSNNYVLVDTVNIINKFLTRSIISYDYFKLYDQLVSFEGNDFYITPFTELFPNDDLLTFGEIYSRLNHVITVGYFNSNQQPILNPRNNCEISSGCHIITISPNNYEILIDTQESNIEVNNTKMIIDIPNKKVNKKILILGNAINIDKSLISNFINSNFINNNCKEVKNFYPFLAKYDKYFWINLLDLYDVIIINISDKDNLKLNLYLYDVLSDDEFQLFREKCVNIITNPIYAQLLEENKFIKSNIVLSHELVGKYITQLLYAPKLEIIFDEITQPKGSEPYVIKRDSTYSTLWNYDIETLKKNLRYNDMIYLGAFIKNDEGDEVFEFNSDNFKKSQRIVVLSKGKEVKSTIKKKFWIL